MNQQIETEIALENILRERYGIEVPVPEKLSGVAQLKVVRCGTVIGHGEASQLSTLWGPPVANESETMLLAVAHSAPPK